MTTREHLQSFHTAAASHHTTMAKSHTRLATHYGKATEMEGNKDLAAEHKAMADSHATMAEHHLSMCKTVGDDLNKLIPDNVSAVIPEFPGLRAVPRYGQRPIPEVANVAPEFAKLVQVEDDL